MENISEPNAPGCGYSSGKFRVCWENVQGLGKGKEKSMSKDLDTSKEFGFVQVQE